MSATIPMPAHLPPQARMLLTQPVIALIAFLTVVDLFATQAILPSLARAYAVSPATMGNAVNAATFGMALAGLAVAFLGPGIDRRRWICIALTTLAIPTLLLSLMPNLVLFTVLRIAQGFCMATAFSLTLAYLGESCSMRASAGAFAAYITGNVASNLIGRLISASMADEFGLAVNFLTFSALNLLGAILVWSTLRHREQSPGPFLIPPCAAWIMHARNPALRAIFGVGFCILFIFLGTFTFINFTLIQAPLHVSPMALGVVHFVFLPAVFTTPLAGRAVALCGRRNALFLGLAVTAAGLPLLVAAALPAVLIGLILVSAGTFLAQAVATGGVGIAASTERASASGLYLAAYYLGGLVGTAVLGQIHDRLGWHATVVAIALTLLAAAGFAARLRADHP